MFLDNEKLHCSPRASGTRGRSASCRSSMCCGWIGGSHEWRSNVRAGAGAAVAKSRQDFPAAMKLFHEDMLLETPAFGTKARGLAENENVLTRFFTSFPDYNV